MYEKSDVNMTPGIIEPWAQMCSHLLTGFLQTLHPTLSLWAGKLLPLEAR